jgi:hypothetical protein
LKIIDADFGLVLGEPDVRFSAYGSWNGYDENCADFDFPVLDLSAKRYVFMISMLKNRVKTSLYCWCGEPEFRPAGWGS